MKPLSTDLIPAPISAALSKHAAYLAAVNDLTLADMEQQLTIEFHNRAHLLTAKSGTETLLSQAPAYIARRLGFYAKRAFYKELSHRHKTESLLFVEPMQIAPYSPAAPETESINRTIALLRNIEVKYNLTFSDAVWDALNSARTPKTDTNLTPLAEWIGTNTAALNPDADPETERIIALFFAGVSLRRMLRENLATRRKAQRVGRKLRELLTA